MKNSTAAIIGAVSAATISGVFALLVAFISRTSSQPLSLQGAVMRSDPNERARSPLKNIEVKYRHGDGLWTGPARTETNGGFSLTLERQVKPGDKISLQFHRRCYQDLEETIGASDVLLTRYLWPDLRDTSPECQDPTITTLHVSTGHVEQTFSVRNRGTVRCDRGPCSPDGKWKASETSFSLVAGSGRQSVSASASCIAGPCPFTKIITDGYSKGGATIRASVLNWSDTATYLLEGDTGLRSLDFTDYAANKQNPRSFTFTILDDMSAQLVGEADNGEHLVVPNFSSINLYPGADWVKCTGTQIAVPSDKPSVISADNGTLIFGGQTGRAFKCRLAPNYQLAAAVYKKH